MSREPQTFYPAPAAGPIVMGWGSLYRHDIAVPSQVRPLTPSSSTPSKSNTPSLTCRPGRRCSPGSAAPRQTSYSAPTHHRCPKRLKDVQGLLEDFIETMGALGDKLGPIPGATTRGSSVEQESLGGVSGDAAALVSFALEVATAAGSKTRLLPCLKQCTWLGNRRCPLPPRVPRVTANFAYVRWHGRPGNAAPDGPGSSPAPRVRYCTSWGVRRSASMATRTTGSPAMRRVTVRRYGNVGPRGRPLCIGGIETRLLLTVSQGVAIHSMDEHCGQKPPAPAGVALVGTRRVWRWSVAPHRRPAPPPSRPPCTS